MLMKNSFRTLLLVVMALATAPLAVASETIEDRWYVVELMDQRSGWMRTLVERNGGGDITTTTSLNLKISRGQMTIPIKMSGVFIETRDGQPVSMSGSQQLGQAPIESSWVFSDGKTGKVKATSVQFGNTTESEIDPPRGEWMTPFAATQHIENLIEDGATTIVTNTIDPAMGLVVVETTATIKGKTTIEALGRTVPAIQWEATTSAAPGVKSVEYVNLEGEPIRTEVDFGGISMSIILADKQLALSRLDPAEIMVSTFVKPSKPIKSPRHTRRAEYRLSLTSGEEFELAETGSQTWSRDGDSINLKVLAEPGESHGAKVKDLAPFLASTSTADLHDPEIIKLVEHALVQTANQSDADKAELLRRFVHSFINEKSLAVGFATASEVCRTRQGDCSEHGVLLTTMLRGAGIPSRVVSGLIYADSFAGERQIFGYHMWSQALLEIDGVMRWVDLDATLPDSTPYDATHIAVALSDLADGEAINSMAGLAPMLGKLQIEVISAE
jgi:hypothetical protein